MDLVDLRFLSKYTLRGGFTESDLAKYSQNKYQYDYKTNPASSALAYFMDSLLSTQSLGVYQALNIDHSRSY